MKIRENPIVKKQRYSGWAQVLKPSFCLWKALSKLEGIHFLKEIPARGRLFLQVEN